MARGVKKADTQKKMDRTRVWPFYITLEQKALYDQDDYKYLIHLYRVFPGDEFHILQYLLLKFHPLILRVATKYRRKGIELDWLDIVSFARYSFVELIHRFPLDSTIYFCVYIPLALDRAMNDWLLYDIRRKDLASAVRLDGLPTSVRDSVLESGTQATNDNDLTEDTRLAWQQECLAHVEHLDIPAQDKVLFRQHFVEGTSISELSKVAKVPSEVLKRRLGRIMAEVKAHLLDVM